MLLLTILGVAHTSRRSLAGCMRPLERGADMPNYGTSAPPVVLPYYLQGWVAHTRPSVRPLVTRYSTLSMAKSGVSFRK